MDGPSELQAGAEIWVTVRSAQHLGAIKSQMDQSQDITQIVGFQLHVLKKKIIKKIIIFIAKMEELRYTERLKNLVNVKAHVLRGNPEI